MSELNERMDGFIKEVRNNSGSKKSLYSSTFWDLLKIRKRTGRKVAYVSQYLMDNGITVSTPNNNFGSEKKKEWITFQHWDIPYQIDAWFEKMKQGVYENEKEVNVFFLTSLFKALGYQEEDFTFEYKVDIAKRLLGMLPRGQRKKFVDLALFDGPDRVEPKLLAICEAKTPKTANTKPSSRNLIDAEKCLKVYRVGCSTAKRFVATNGEMIKVFRRGKDNTEDDIELLMELDRSELKEKWHALYLYLGKPILVKELEG